MERKNLKQKVISIWLVALALLLCSCSQEAIKTPLPPRWDSIPDFESLKVVCLGDSITAGMYVDHGYPEALQSILGIGTMINLGFGGSTISDLNEKSFQPYVERYSQIPKDADIIIVQTQCNDAGRIPIGETDDTDTGTYMGAWNYLLSHVLSEYPTAYVFVIGPNRNANSAALDPYAKAIRTMTQKYGIDLLEMFVCNSNYVYSIDTVDGCHHTQKYIDETLAPWVARFILNNYKP